MKSKKSFGKALIAIILCFTMIFTMGIPAFATEERYSYAGLIEDDPVDHSVSDTQRILEILMDFVKRDSEHIKRVKEYAASWAGIASAYFNPLMSVTKNISSIISLVNGSITLLQRLGVIEGEKDKTQSILDGINSIKLTVNEIDKKVDKLQETLVSEFSELDMKFQEQDYNHYKNEVWAQFYSNAVVPLTTLQNEYKDDVCWLLVDYIEQWLGSEDCQMDLRALYGKNDNGEFYQVYSGKNIGDVNTSLPRAPRTSIDSVPVEYSVTIPAEYITANLDEKTALTADNCTDKLISALEKGVYDAAQDKKLSAYDGFQTEWNYMTEAEKTETAKKFANDLADSLAFTCAYNAANERRFASNVKSAYDNFTKWIQGEESLTSPAFAQFKMLSLTHGFEGEIRDEANTIVTYLMLMDVNFSTFAQTVISLSKAHDESDTDDIQSGWLKSEASIYSDYAKFMTGNPNYCYQLGKNIEYKNAAITSDLSFVYSTFYNQYNDRLADYADYYTSTPWVLSEKDATYSLDKTTALSQKAASGEDLQKRSISTKEAKIIYTMYQSSGTKGTFADYLAANKVTLDAENVSGKLITSFNKGDFDLSSGLKMNYYDVVSLNRYGFIDGGIYAVNTETSEKCEDKEFDVHDYVTGGLFNMNDGSFDENARLVSRAFYGESNTLTIDGMYLFSTANTVYNTAKLSKSEVENRGIPYDKNQEDYFNVDVDFNADYGMIVSEENNSYTFPENTKTIPDNVFGTALRYNKITFMGTPETIGNNAFEGVGTKTNRCLLVAPEGMVKESLVDKWHGGYFGDIQITLIKNDGTNEEKTVAAVKGASISTVLCPFTAPEGRTFKGWSLTASKAVLSDSETVTEGKTLYAVWEYSHEHDFEEKSVYKAPTCTQAGSTVERICKTCGLEEKSEVIPALGHSCVFTKNALGNYYAECTECGYSAVLYPTTAGDYTVWSEDKSGSAVEYTVTPTYVGCVTIKESGIYVIENTDKTSVSRHRIKIADNVVASVGLADVKVATYVALPAIDAGNTSGHFTLIDGTENYVYGSNKQSAISAKGNLIIDGSGALIATAQSAYAISASGINTIINSGNIKAECEKSFTQDTRGIGIFSDSPNSRFVISENACVYSTGGTNVPPTNADGDNVYAVRIDNEKNESITVDGKEFPYTAAPGEKAAYIYLTAEEHEIKIGDDELEHNWIYGPSYFEKQFGGFIVTTTNIESISYADNVLTVKDSTPVTIRNAENSSTTDTIFVPAGVNANITLNGVFIEGSADRPSPIKIADGSDGDVKITLAEKSENTLIAKFEGAGISKNGSAGTLTIDGKGTLNVQGGYYDGAAIGSEAGNVVHGIIIKGGIINATVHTDRAAAVGSGYMSAENAPTGDKIYVAEGIIISGGKITARSENGAAIGAGVVENADGKTFCVKDIIINEGVVNAKGTGADYSIGAGDNVSAENIRINGGVVTAESTQFSGGGIGAGLGAEIIIEPFASVKAADLSNTPVNSEGANTYLKIVDVEPVTYITIDGQIFPYTDHEGEAKVYIYLKPLLALKVGTAPQLVIEESENGTVSANVETPKAGDKVTLTASANDGYVFKGFEATPEVEIKDNSFTMPEYGVTVKAVFARVGKITVKDCENCKVTPSKTVAAAGEKITLRIVPDTGMELSRWDVAAGNVTVTNNSFIMPEEDVVISGICTPISYKVTWDVSGYTTSTYMPFGTRIDKPANPEREGYTFDGWTPEVPETMPTENLSFSAVFTPITYNATFVAGGKIIAKVPYTVEDTSVAEPSIPQKTGYVSSWGSYKLEVGGITVNAEYVPELYKAKFVADGKVIDEIPYTVETVSIDAPAIPNKEGYTAKWSDYTLHAGGITVNAIYTASSHEHTFATKYSTNEYMHWYASTCGHEDIAKGLGEHTFGAGIKAGSATIYICSECSYVKIVNDELAELKAQAIAELESAAGSNRSEAMQAALDLAKTAVERANTKEEVESAKESGLAVIKASEFAIGNCTLNSNLIYGLTPMLTEASFSENYIVNETVSVEYNPSSDGVLGTGSTVSVTYYSGKTDEYTLVIFGDVNGDGIYDGTDSIIVNCLANGLLSKEQVGEAKYMAADCNHDGVVDSADVTLLEQAGLVLAGVNQNKSPAELKADSAYIEYLSLIDQNPAEGSTTDDAPTEEITVDEGFNQSLLQRVIAFIIYIFKMIKSFIIKQV